MPELPLLDQDENPVDLEDLSRVTFSHLFFPRDQKLRAQFDAAASNQILGRMKEKGLFDGPEPETITSNLQNGFGAQPLYKFIDEVAKKPRRKSHLVEAKMGHFFAAHYLYYQIAIANYFPEKPQLAAVPMWIEFLAEGNSMETAYNSPLELTETRPWPMDQTKVNPRRLEFMPVAHICLAMHALKDSKYDMRKEDSLALLLLTSEVIKDLAIERGVYGHRNAKVRVSDLWTIPAAYKSAAEKSITGVISFSFQFSDDDLQNISYLPAR